MEKITKEEYLSLVDENITMVKYNAIINKINKRFQYIMEMVCTKLSWYDYTNGHDETNGYFNPHSYQLTNNDKHDYISFEGVYTIPPPYNGDIPIRWLWEDFECEFRKAIDQYKINEEEKKIKAKQKRIELEEKKAKMRASIELKLTKEELSFINFLEKV
jgi:hypothetical protein